MRNRLNLKQLRVCFFNERTNPMKSSRFSYMHFIFPIIFFTILLSTNVINVSAAPLSNIPQTLTQPDNTEISCFASGDEFFNYYHDAEGYLIIKNDDTGYYTYAQINNGDIVASNNVVNTNSSRQSITAKNNRITISDVPQTYIEDKYASNGAYANNSMSIRFESENGASSRDQTVTPANKFVDTTMQNLVIFVSFADTTEDWPSVSDVAKYNNLFLGTNGGPSLKEYINEISYGKTQINSILGGPTNTQMYWYQADCPRSAYFGDANAELRLYNMLKEAAETIVGLVPANVNLDANNDDEIDCITFLVWGDAVVGSALWPHQGKFDNAVNVNGQSINFYNMQVQNIANYDVLAHEVLHVIGFPDLYLYGTESDNSDYPVGRWDVMSSGQGHPNAYSKRKYGGWIAETSEDVITTPGTYTLNPLSSSTNNCKIIKSPFDSDEYIVIEYRKKEGTYESSIPGSGLLIYKINPTKCGNMYAPYDPEGTNCEVFVYRPFNGQLYGDVLNANFSANVGRTYANPYNSDPLLRYDGGVNSRVVITNIGVAGDTISFDVEFYFFSDPIVEQAVRTAINKPTGKLSLSDLEQVTEITIVGNVEEINLEGIEYLKNLERIHLSGNAYMAINNTDFSYGNGFEFDSLSLVSSGISLDSVYVTINRYNAQNFIFNTESKSVSLSNGKGTYRSVSSMSYLGDASEHIELLGYLDSDHDVLISRQIVQPVLFEF